MQMPQAVQLLNHVFITLAHITQVKRKTVILKPLQQHTGLAIHEEEWSLETGHRIASQEGDFWRLSDMDLEILNKWAKDL